MAALVLDRLILSNIKRVCTLTFVRSKSDAHIAMTDDTSTVVCWHPEETFPYEMSRPIPKKLAVKQSDSILKVQSSREVLSVLKPKRHLEVIEELSRMTYTTKHIWFPRKQQFRRKKHVPGDRPYL